MFPLTKIQGTNSLRILCLNTLERTSFVVQVERTSTWVCNTKNKKWYISCGSVQVEHTSTWCFKDNKGGYIPCESLLVKDFTRLKEISRTSGCLGTGCRHGLLSNQYKNLCLFSSSLNSLISALHFLFPLYFCLSYCFCSLLSHNLVVKPN